MGYPAMITGNCDRRRNFAKKKPRLVILPFLQDKSFRRDPHDMPRPTFILGDIHGDYAGMLAIIDERKIRGAVVIHVGDGHEGFPECGLPVLEMLSQEFGTRRIE